MNPDTSDRPLTRKSRSARANLIILVPLSMIISTSMPATATAGRIFATPFRAFATGPDPASVAIGDLNADGTPDLVVANSGNSPGGSVSVLLGNGDGTFGSKMDYDTGASPRSVVICDLNGDGNPDLATANRAADTVSVLLGDGHGSFGPKTDYDTGASPRFVAIGDLNDDGIPDLATANSGANTVSVLLGNPAGTFGSRADYGTGDSPSSIVIGDLNGDGDPDLTTADSGSSMVSVLLNNGDGTFGTKTDHDTGSRPGNLAVGNLNGDGNPDLAVVHPGQSPAYGSSVSVLLGNGDGTFGPWTDYETGESPASVAIGDLDGDGHSDLVTTNVNDATISVLLGSGDGSFGARTDYITERSPLSVAIGDLDHDGRPDLAVANQRSNSVSTLLGNGDGSFGAEVPEFPTGAFPVTLAIGDLNADGKDDLATANRDDGTVSVLLGNGDGSFGSKTDIPAGGTVRSLAIGDLNGDDKPDLVVPYDVLWYGGLYGWVSVLLGNGDGSFQPLPGFYIVGSAFSTVIGDMNDDGKPDLVVAYNAQGVDIFDDYCAVAVALGSGDGNFGATTDYGLVSRYINSVAIADLNADGIPDLVGTSSSPFGEIPPPAVSVRLGTGDGSFGPVTPYFVNGEPYYVGGVAIGDLNGDGKPDLAAGGSRTFSVLLGNGDGSFGLSTVIETGVGTGHVAIGDLDGDGNADLAALRANALWIQLGNGDGTFRSDGDYGVSSPASVSIVDLNGDTRPDVVVPSFRPNAVSVLLNISPPPCPSAPMIFDLVPGTINLRSTGHWVTAVLEPEPPAVPTDIDLSSIRLNGSVPVDPTAPTSVGDVDDDGRPDLTVKFDRAALLATIEAGDAAAVSVSGRIGSVCFEATDVIRVLRAHGMKLKWKAGILDHIKPAFPPH